MFFQNRVFIEINGVYQWLDIPPNPYNTKPETRPERLLPKQRRAHNRRKRAQDPKRILKYFE